MILAPEIYEYLAADSTLACFRHLRYHVNGRIVDRDGKDHGESDQDISEAPSPCDYQLPADLRRIASTTEEGKELCQRLDEILNELYVKELKENTDEEYQMVLTVTHDEGRNATIAFQSIIHLLCDRYVGLSFEDQCGELRIITHGAQLGYTEEDDRYELVDN